MITWSEKYSVKNNLIDSQHKKLILLVNQLHTAMKEGKGRDALQTVLDELVSYTQEHFKDEEAMMVRGKFPGYNLHKIEHENLTKKAASLQEQYRSGKTPLTLDVMTFLSDWLVNHIEGSDKKYIGKIS